ncbi:alkyl/aryl-sulfatase [Shimia abyssi]|uniref:Putative sulfatase n=1 Tax=Shimia abyssi TaxID=1662395 RepID=A0A2P8FDH9_9RHOB|nr:alkyl/aryl-sulfatase [Shimia abyssi]PSL19728.1 putative sulfatase [Shimia abyssi]
MHAELRKHPEYFQKEVVQLADNVYQAFGFAASNVYMIVGLDGVIIVDTTETTTAAQNILAEFRKITDLPVKTIILTHSHRDHVSGASVFAEGGTPEILASARSSEDPLIVATKHPRAAKAMQARTKRQFGIGLSYPDEIIGIGVGPGDRPLKGMGAGILPPTRKIGDEGETLTRCGIELELAIAPGETPDHLVVWYPEKKVLFCGDNFYRSFPNLYAIRGTEYRDFDTWADTMDQLMAFAPDVLAPGHTKAVMGAERINDVLTDYRDAIRYITSETRKGMDAGLTMDQLAKSVELPSELAEKPHLREYYGRVAYAVRAYFVGTMGWFDGNPTSLNPLAPKEEAERFIGLAGGGEAVLQAARDAAEKGDFQWSLQLADRLISTGRHAEEATALKSETLLEYAKIQINCPTRHYYIQCAKELSDAAD